MSIETQTVAEASELEELKARLDAWRQGRKKGVHVPKELWEAAVALSKQHTVAELSRVLRLDYGRLKKRIIGSGQNAPPEKGSAPRFVKIDTPEPALDADCVVELENAKGVKLRMLFRKGSDLDFAALGKAFWRNGG